MPLGLSSKAAFDQTQKPALRVPSFLKIEIFRQIGAWVSGMPQEPSSAIGANNRWMEPGNSRHHRWIPRFRGMISATLLVADIPGELCSNWFKISTPRQKINLDNKTPLLIRIIIVCASGYFNMLCYSQTRYTIHHFDLSALKKQCLIYLRPGVSLWNLWLKMSTGKGPLFSWILEPAKHIAPHGLIDRASVFWNKAFYGISNKKRVPFLSRTRIWAPWTDWQKYFPIHYSRSYQNLCAIL